MKSMIGQLGGYLRDVSTVLHDLLQTIKRPIWHNPAKGSIVVTNPTAADLAVTASIASTQTLTTVTTVGTVTTLSQMAGFDVKQTVMFDTMRIAWGQNVRRLIT
jgi:hypothetical protein